LSQGSARGIDQRRASAGQLAAAPEHVSATSHEPVDARHGVPAAASPSTGHVALAPVELDAAAFDHLLGLGHRRIAIIAGRKGWVASEERVNGYQAALAGAGVLATPALVMRGNFEMADGHKAAHRLLALDEPPTAIFASNDNMAVGALRAAAERNLRVPADLSVVGFDDSELARVVTPNLTTVRQPLEEMGRMAVSLLTRLIDGQSVETLRVELATRLVIRQSTAPPPQS